MRDNEKNTDQYSKCKNRRDKYLGIICERVAARWLIFNNELILDKNFWIKNIGELDLITLTLRSINFYEVKGRRIGTGYKASEALTWQKKERVFKLGEIYFKKHYRAMRQHRVFIIDYYGVAVSYKLMLGGLIGIFWVERIKM